MKLGCREHEGVPARPAAGAARFQGAALGRIGYPSLIGRRTVSARGARTVSS